MAAFPLPIVQLTENVTLAANNALVSIGKGFFSLWYSLNFLLGPCYICGPHAECTAREHTAVCACPPGRIGNPLDKQVGCYIEPDLPIESRTIPPPSGLEGLSSL